MLEAFSMIRVHRLLFVIAVAAGLVSKFSHVHGLSVFLHLSTSSNPDFEKNMDLTAFVTLIDEFVTQGTKFKLCALVFQRINDLGILSRPKTKHANPYHRHPYRAARFNGHPRDDRSR